MFGSKFPEVRAKPVDVVFRSRAQEAVFVHHAESLPLVVLTVHAIEGLGEFVVSEAKAAEEFTSQE